MTNVEGLTDTISHEITKYKELLELAQGKRDAIVNRRLEELERVTASEQKLADDLKALEGRRAGVLRTFTDGEEIPTVTDVIGALPEGSEERDTLTKLRDDVVAVATEMQFVNSQNEVLLQQALEMVEFDLTLFKSLRQAPESGNYGKDAYSTGDLLPTGGFDAKQ